MNSQASREQGALLWLDIMFGAKTGKRMHKLLHGYLVEWMHKTAADAVG